ncbi:hypothetical protein MAR_010952 [Mya arenaria]|uniref:Uncharacterized protein n=1 Tax=Mya arenaria TaxID=6604 RepID=A0ABY7FSQ1_MYAAR|nr:hypothetical protein MAR_010952 [Mya arenaria]
MAEDESSSTTISVQYQGIMWQVDHWTLAVNLSWTGLAPESRGRKYLTGFTYTIDGPTANNEQITDGQTTDGQIAFVVLPLMSENINPYSHVSVAVFDDAMVASVKPLVEHSVDRVVNGEFSVLTRLNSVRGTDFYAKHVQLAPWSLMAEDESSSTTISVQYQGIMWQVDHWTLAVNLSWTGLAPESRGRKYLTGFTYTIDGPTANNEQITDGQTTDGQIAFVVLPLMSENINPYSHVSVAVFDDAMVASVKPLVEHSVDRVVNGEFSVLTRLNSVRGTDFYAKIIS